MTLIDYTRWQPAIDVEVFPQSFGFVVSSTRLEATGFYWGVNFDLGTVDFNGGQGVVRCVRESS